MRGDAKTCGCGAVIGEQRLQAVVLQVCVDVFKTWCMVKFLEKLRAILQQIFGGFSLQRVLISRVGRSAADANILNGL